MNRVPVKSSNVASVGYDEATTTLEVEYKNNAIYQYFLVPARTYEELISVSLNGQSVGRYLDKNIKRVGYRYVKI